MSVKDQIKEALEVKSFNIAGLPEDIRNAIITLFQDTPKLIAELEAYEKGIQEIRKMLTGPLSTDYSTYIECCLTDLDSDLKAI
jgi:hypothetical protein